MPTVEFINLKESYVILEDGRTLPIVSFIDHDGNPTEDLSDTHLLLCGDPDLGWFVILMEDIDPIDLH